MGELVGHGNVSYSQETTRAFYSFQLSTGITCPDSFKYFKLRLSGGSQKHASLLYPLNWKVHLKTVPPGFQRLYFIIVAKSDLEFVEGFLIVVKIVVIVRFFLFNFLNIVIPPGSCEGLL